MRERNHDRREPLPVPTTLTKGLFLLLLLLTGPAFAASPTSAFGWPASGTLAGAPIRARDTYICVIPDTQNQTNPKEEEGAPNAPLAVGGADGCNIQSTCTKNCTNSTLCKTSWVESGIQVLRNQTLSLLRKPIDWTGMTGEGYPMPVLAKPIDQPPHPRCDLILHVGDSIDTGDAQLGASSGNTYNQWMRLKGAMLTPLLNSGIPFLFVPGNHDDLLYYEQDFLVPFRTKPYYYADTSASFSVFDTGVTRTSYMVAMLAPTPAGPICVVGTPYYGTTVANTPNATLQAASLTYLGCGGGYPTILLQHYTGEGHFSAAIFDGTHPQVFAQVWGHDTLSPGNDLTASVIGGNTIYQQFCNFQEMDRLVLTDYGQTPSDGAGGAYCVIKLSPDDDMIASSAWVTYYQTHGNVAQGFTNGLRARESFSFDFDARFP